MEGGIVSSVERLLEAASERGATFELEGGQVVVVAPNPLPSDLMIQLRARRTEITSHLGLQPEQQDFMPWVLQEWRRVSIHDWRRILQECVGTGDGPRADYARWMLKEVLEAYEH